MRYNTVALQRLSQDEGISAASLHKWRAEAQVLPDADAGPQGWTSRDKFAAVLETAVLTEAQMEWFKPFFPLSHGVPRVDE